MSGVALLGRPLRVTVVAGLTLLLLLCRLQKAEGAPASLAKRETQSHCYPINVTLQAGNIVPLNQVRPDDFPEYFQLTLNVTCRHGKIGHPLCMEWQNTSTRHLAGQCETALSKCLLKTYKAAYAIRSKRLAMNTERTRYLIAILASRQPRSTTGSSQHIADVEGDIMNNCLSSAAVSVVQECSGQLTDENALYACTAVAESSPLGPVSTITMVATVLGACLVAILLLIVVVSVVVVAHRKNWLLSVSRSRTSTGSGASLPEPINRRCLPLTEPTEITPLLRSTTTVDSEVHPPRSTSPPSPDSDVVQPSGTSPLHDRKAGISYRRWSQSSNTLLDGSSSESDDDKLQQDRKAYRRSQSSNNLYGVSSSSDELQHAGRKHRPKGIFSEDGASDHRIKKPSPPHRRPASPPVLLNGPIHTDSSDSLVPKTSDSSDSLDARRPAGQSSDPSSSSSGAPLLEDAKKGSNGSGHEGDNEMSPSHSECSSTPNSSLEGPPKRDPKKESPSALPVPPEQIETSPKCSDSEGSSEETSSSNTSDSPPTSDSSLPVPLNPHPLTEPTESTPLIEPTTSDEVPPTRSTSPPARP